MSNAMSRSKSRWKGALLATVAGAAVSPVVAHATLTVSLQIDPTYVATLTSEGITVSPTSLIMIGGGVGTNVATGAPTFVQIPIDVYATVSGGTVVTAPPLGGAAGASATPPSSTGNFDGLQYLYYNVTNAGNTIATEVPGGINTPVLNSTLGFNALPSTQPQSNDANSPSGSSQTGGVYNILNGVSLGSTGVMTDYAKPRAASAVFQNYVTYNQTSGLYTAIGNDGKNIIVSANGLSVSYLVETFNYSPSAYNTSTPTVTQSGISVDAEPQTILSPVVPNFGTQYSAADWFSDHPTSTNGGASDPQAFSTLNTNGSSGYVAGTGVTLTQAIKGDANGDGFVNGTDFTLVTTHFGLTVTPFTNGDTNGDGIVNGTDFTNVTTSFGQTLISPITGLPLNAADAAELDQIVAFADAHDLAVPAFITNAVSAVPEPGTFTILGFSGGMLMLRRRKASVAK